MHGRMIHAPSPIDGDPIATPQAYDIHGRFIRAADRAALNKALLNELAGYDNVRLFFDHRLAGADLNRGLAWVEDRSLKGPESGNANLAANQQAAGKTRPEEREISFDLLLGADGAHSAVRYHLMKFARVSYTQSYIETLWAEFHIAPAPAPQGSSADDTDFAISPHHLHIWPSPKGSAEPMMFIAIPSSDKSFTCTLFASPATFQHLEADPARHVVPFFEQNFPGIAPTLILPDDLVAQFRRNPHLPLISVKCTPHHYVGQSKGEDIGGSRKGAVILGDAAHAMVPFYGQGMNAGLEDVRVLFETLDEHRGDLEAALEAYTRQRTPDSHAIVDLSMANFEEMREGVTSPVYKARKAVEEVLSVYAPWTGFRTQYSRVSFSDERYSEVMQNVERQGRVLSWTGGVTAVALLGMGVAWMHRAGVMGRIGRS